MRILAGCEYSGSVRRAFRDAGHDAWSCDLLDAEDGSPFHIKGDISKVLHDGWDMLLAFPPCTHLCVSGARWFKDKIPEQRQAIWFFSMLAHAPIERIAIENPIGIMSSVWRKPDQIVHPWWFGVGETKSTCLWLKNLPKLTPTNVVDGRVARVHRMAPGPDRGRERSRTPEGFGEAMAAQWGNAPTLATISKAA